VEAGGSNPLTPTTGPLSSRSCCLSDSEEVLRSSLNLTTDVSRQLLRNDVSVDIALVAESQDLLVA